MAENNVERKLRAILCADVKGYSRMMGEDEEGTYQTLTANLGLIRSIILDHKGRVFSSPGDAVMAEFASVVNAVKCAVELQDKIEAANAYVHDDQKMQFRIGVNLGDVIHDGEQVYGDGVNVAARIETLGEPGGVSISRNVYNNVYNKLKFGYEYQGEHQVKNIAEPVRVYKVLTTTEHAGQLIGETKVPKFLSKKPSIAIFAVLVIFAVSVIWHFYTRTPKIEPSSIEKMAYPLPDKPSIAVLPFDNMSGDPDQEHFSDGISEEIINALSKTDKLFVIARSSSFTYKDKPIKVQQVSRELGVRYVLEGSVRKSEDRVRITAQLIDTTTGHHLWSERYDRELKDIFALQDEITLQIVRALEIKLTEGEQVRMWSKHYNSLDVYLKRMEAHSLWREGTVESHMRHAQISQEIIDMVPESPSGYMSLGYHHWWLAQIGKFPQENLKKALELAQKAISLDKSDPVSHELLASIYLSMRQYDKAISIGERAIELDPSGAEVYAMLGSTLSYAGRPDDAIAQIKKAMRLNPFPEPWYFYDLGRCYLLKGQYEKALTEYKKYHQLSPKAPWPHLFLAVTYVLLDRQEEAHASAEKCLELAPFVSVGRFTKISTFKIEADTELITDAMRKAGFPE